MAFNPDEYLSKNAAASSFDPDAYLESVSNGEPSDNPAESTPAALSTGIMNGATANFAPAIGGLGKTAMNAITGVSGPLAGGSLDDLVDEYRRNRDQLKEDFAKAAKAHPVISGVGNLAGGGALFGALGPAATSAEGLLGTGAAMGLGASNADLTKGELGGAAIDTGEGAATNLVAGKVANAALPYAGKAITGVSNYFRGAGEKLAEKATGATGHFAKKQFADNTGRELLDRGIVQFGDSPGDIALKANEAIEKSQAGISDILENQLQGITVDRKTVLNYIRGKIAAMSGDESKTGLVRRLRGETKNIQNKINDASENVVLPLLDNNPEVSQLKLNYGKPEIQDFNAQIPDPINPGTFANESNFTDLKSMGEELVQRHARAQRANFENVNHTGFNPYGPAGQVEVMPVTKTGVIENSEIPIDFAEKVKRGYQNNSNYLNPDADISNKIVAGGYRQAVEDAATQANPELAKQFKADKSTYGLLAPVREAAATRAGVLNQSPLGGLLDVATAIKDGLPAVAARRTFAPRIASSAAVSADKIGKILSSDPGRFGSFQSVLESAAARGGSSLGATDYILNQTNPQYRAQKSQALGNEEEENK